MSNRRNAVLLALAGAALMLISVTMTWVTAEQLGETASVQSIEVPGSQASDIVTAMGLVALAGALTLTIARRVGRWIIALLLSAAAAAALFDTFGAVADPASAAAAAVGEATGITTTAGSYELGAGPWLGVAGAVLVLLAALLVLLFSHRWTDKRSSKKYSRDASADDAEPDEFDLWDGLSAGEDPTEERQQ